MATIEGNGAARPAAAGDRGTALLRVVDIVKRYAGVTALDGVSLEVAKGEVLALLGENGSGKSTLIRAIAGVERPDAGHVFIDGTDWTSRPPADRIGAGVQIIYQDFAPFPNLTAAENIWLPKQLNEGRRLISRSAGRAMAERVLADIGVAVALDRTLSDLPVSHKQIVAIARALAHDARLLIMDEPTTALTHREVENLMAIIRRLAAGGMSFIFVSHKLREVADICERAVVLRNGKKTLDASLEGLREADIERAMTGREISSARYDRPAGISEAPPLLEVEGLGGEGGYQDVSFRLAPGEILGLAGLMGAGRTALAKGLFALPPPDRGTVRLGGKPVALSSVGEAAAAGIAYVPEDRLSEGLFLTYSIRDNIVVRALDRIVSPTGWLTRRRKSEEARRWMERLAVKASSDAAPVSSLSGGNQQRVVLAKWLASRPRVLILNRPTVGVDVGSKSGIHDIIVELAESGVGIIMISDDMPELMRVCDRILVMRNGRLVAERRVADSTEAEILEIVSESAS